MAKEMESRGMQYDTVTVNTVKTVYWYSNTVVQPLLALQTGGLGDGRSVEQGTWHVLIRADVSLHAATFQASLSGTPPPNSALISYTIYFIYFTS